MNVKGRTIRQRLMRFTSAALTLAMAALIAVLGGVAIIFLVNLTNDLQDTETNAVEQAVAIWYSERMAEVRSIQETIENYNMTSDAEYDIKGYLAHMRTKNEPNGIYDYYIGLEDKRCYAGSDWEPDPDEYDPTTRDWYKAAKAADDIVVSEAYVDADTGRVVITMSIAVHENGAFVGAFAADIFTDDVQAIASDSFDAEDSKYVALVDSAGTIIAHKNEGLLPYVDADGTEHLTDYKDAGIPDSVIGADELVKKIGSDYSGIFRVYTGQKLEAAGVSIIVVDKGLHYYRGVLIFFLSCLVLVFIIIIVTRMMTRKYLFPLLNPLNELIDVAENMSKGELQYVPSYTAEDEIGTLCAAIEESNRSIRGYIADVAEKLGAIAEGDLTAKVTMDYIGDFEELKASINRISDSLNSTMKTILQSADTVHDHAKNVSGEADDLSTNVSGVNSRIDEAHNQISDVKERFSENLSQTKDSMELSASMTEDIRSSYSNLEALLTAMDEISEKSSSIAEIIDIINQIASKTNLLALNASIEAARAGEAGKGFAVVADNVRELASQTADAVASSEELIKESVAAVEEGSRLVNLAVEEMKGVVEKTEDVNAHIGRIADSIREETAIVEAVAESISGIDNFARETESTSKECVDMTRGLYEEVDTMHEIVGKFEL